jgi:hypothetical protein
MSARHVDRHERRREEEEQIDVPDQAEKPDQDNKSSTITNDVIDDIDNILKEQLGFEKDEEVRADEFNEKARMMLEGYIQKGGQ